MWQNIHYLKQIFTHDHKRVSKDCDENVKIGGFYFIFKFIFKFIVKEDEIAFAWGWLNEANTHCLRKNDTTAAWTSRQAGSHQIHFWKTQNVLNNEIDLEIYNSMHAI